MADPFAMSEKQLQQCVTDLCKLLGLRHWHVVNSKGMTPGWPDSVVLGPNHILYRELKSELGQMTPEQTAVSYALRAAGCDFAVWRPRHWLAGTIEAELRCLLGQPKLPL